MWKTKIYEARSVFLVVVFFIFQLTSSIAIKWWKTFSITDILCRSHKETCSIIDLFLTVIFFLSFLISLLPKSYIIRCLSISHTCIINTRTNMKMIEDAFFCSSAINLPLIFKDNDEKWIRLSLSLPLCLAHSMRKQRMPSYLASIRLYDRR